ncbi:prenylcysteine oxidase [Xylaria sp. CBS 124048]|nr:prenylcysteine oxidase [Xylaria sp. CBS 124048]
MFLHHLLSLPFLLPTWASSGVLGSSEDVKQIAVIGAGAAGSSAAYHLRKYAEESGIVINVTVFEKSSRIGGRAVTVNVYDDPIEPIELGASIFVDVNYILVNATRDLGLTTKDPDTNEGELLGVWDGDSFVYTQDSNSWNWVNLVRLLWRYGTAPYYTKKLVQKTVATFLKLYEEPFFPFPSLSARAFQLDLVKLTGMTGSQFLAANNLPRLFSHDIIQASTRVNYASNLDFIHGLSTMVAMAPEGAKTIEGGNWQIFANMVKASKAALHLNSTVTNIRLNADQKYEIETAEETGDEKSRTTQSRRFTFDDVIIATPFQFANISMDEIAIQHPIDVIPYATLHVTLFASPYEFSPAFFKLPPTSKVPSSVLTTLGGEDASLPGQSGAGTAGFYSATLLRIAMNPLTHRPDYVYKIFSPDAVTPEFLSKLLGVKVPDSFTQNGDVKSDNIGDDATNPVSWFHATVFHPYPQLSPRVTFQDPILRDGLYYTSGIESFISTMETSALMGMNVARLIIDDYADIPRPGDDGLGAMHMMPNYEGVGQNVLGQKLGNKTKSYRQPLAEVNEL